MQVFLLSQLIIIIMMSHVTPVTW